jgi:hypothetical protein
MANLSMETLNRGYRSLKRIVEVMASMDMANAIANMTPSLLEAAMGFDKLVTSTQSLMADKD